MFYKFYDRPSDCKTATLLDRFTVGPLRCKTIHPNNDKDRAT